MSITKISDLNGNILDQSENNSDVYVDTTHGDAELSWTRRVMESEAFDTEAVGYIEYNPRIYSRIGIVALNDMHFGGSDVKLKRAEVGFDFIFNTSNVIAVGGGDNSDCTYGVSNTHDQKVNSVRAEDLLVQDLYPIRNKIVGYVPGNHDSPEGGRNVDSNTARAKSVANRLMIPYFPYGFVLSVDLPIPNTSKSKRMSVFVFHCSGKSSGKAGSIDTTFEKARNALASMGIVPDVIVGGHFHSGVGGYFPWVYSLKNKQGIVIGKKVKNVKVISSMSMQASGPYAAFNNMRENTANFNFFDIGWKKNPYYSTTNESINEEYIPDIVEFPLLHPSENKLSIPACKYQELYHEPYVEMQKIRNKYKKTSIERMFKKYKSEVIDDKEGESTQC